jgi:hypothetical protein
MPEDGIVCLDNGIDKIWLARNYRAHLAATRLIDNPAVRAVASEEAQGRQAGAQ